MSVFDDKTILITGGAGFIGSALVRNLVRNHNSRIVVIDKLTYAASDYALEPVINAVNFVLEPYDICDGSKMDALLEFYRPDAVVHLAAESHVDRSIDSPGAFINTNIVGTYMLLEASLNYWSGLSLDNKERFRFLHVSTDEVFGSLGSEGLFNEATSYAPNSPYSASKAASDHLVRAWHKTFDLPVLITNCTNNYGPYQFLEKLIPTVISKAIRGEAIPVYGQGVNVRDWLYVEDHVNALKRVLADGRVGETYCIGGSCEKNNIEVVTTICRLMDSLVPLSDNVPRESLIMFVEDRPGHDARYAMDTTFIRDSLGWSPKESFESGIQKTLNWYLAHRHWWQDIIEYKFDGKRLGNGERLSVRNIHNPI